MPNELVDHNFLLHFIYCRDRDDYGSNNGERSDKKRSSAEKHRRDRSRDTSSKHDRYSSRGSNTGGGHRSSKHQDRFRDRKR